MLRLTREGKGSQLILHHPAQFYSLDPGLRMLAH